MAHDQLRARITERLRDGRIQVSDAQIEQLATYYVLLERWNRTMNLTSLSLADHPPATLDVLIVEPLVITGLIGDGALEWLDLGSGGGSPAVPIKIARPGFRLTLVEARERKGAFLREVIRSLQLVEASVWTGRIEDFEPQQQAQLVTMRAVRLDPEIAGAVSRMLQVGGTLALYGNQDFSPPSGFELESSSVLPAGHRLHLLRRLAR